jgi:uncharacterized ferritin-like protein (DUF455 family)
MNSASPHPREFADVEDWAAAYVGSRELEFKLAPPPPPVVFRSGAEPRCISSPGRPAQLIPAQRRERTPKGEALRNPRQRARLVHTFFHHELQAAELMCWALLRFPDAELEFRKGLLGICLDEIRHMGLYRDQLRTLGAEVGDFPVRDWFWMRVPACSSKLAFVSVLGMGLEAANLEHARNFADEFRAIDDAALAELQERIGFEERAHVAFAIRWFKRWTGALRYEDWVAALPAPLSPWLLRGEPLAIEARLRAGMSEEFIAALAAHVPTPRGPDGAPAARWR